MGIGPALPRAFDNVDEGARLLKVIEGLRAIKDFDQRLRAARILGVEDALPATNMSDRQFARVKGDAALRAQVLGGPEFQRDAADFASALSRVESAVETASATLSKPAVHDLPNVLNGIADSLNRFSQLMQTSRMQGMAQGAFSGKYGTPAMQSGVGTGLSGGFGLSDTEFGKGLLKGLGFGDDSSNDASASMDRNSNAVDANTEAIQRLTGAFGSPGDRFAGAIPAGLNNEYLRKALESGGLRLPPF